MPETCRNLLLFLVLMLTWLNSYQLTPTHINFISSKLMKRKRFESGTNLAFASELPGTVALDSAR